MSRNIERSNARGDKAMKVKHIKTRYVETDVTSFRSVVQTLTGKDSTIAEYSPPRYSSSMIIKDERVENGRVLDKGGEVGGSFKFLSRDLSFDRMLKELPPLDDLHKFIAND
ncbi:hypothetical protein RND81_14G199200 [Saponaria officinalis]|uniref:VQ domain-containing protein n=1 Tax=Saponaria officinalis TaxID=3572 RepID=A0AAW1GRN8_SAPOF